MNQDEQIITAPAKIRGTIAVPGDKSISHRSLMFGSLAVGTSRITGILESDDIASTIFCLTLLGADIRMDGEDVLVTGKGFGGIVEPSIPLDCGNSGTTARLLAGIISGLPFSSILTGDESLKSRPMARIIDPLTRLGASIKSESSDNLLPLRISPPSDIQDNLVIETGVASAQVKSAILLCALSAGVSVTIKEPLLSRDHTERLLTAMGAEFTYPTKLSDHSVKLLKRESELKSIDMAVPGDISTAAPWIVAATLHEDAELLLEGVGINKTRTGILDIMEMMGASITIISEKSMGGEPVANLLIKSADLKGVIVEGELIPRSIDELTLVALAGSRASGQTIIRDAGELRNKETDRIGRTVDILRGFGVDIVGTDDGFLVKGGGKLRPSVSDSYGDHRLAMLAAVAGILVKGQSRVTNASAVNISYPAFWSEFERVCGDSTI